MSSKLRWNEPADNILGSATVVAGTWSELALFPLTNLALLDPASPVKFNAQAGTIKLDFGSSTSVQLVVLGHHNLDAGLEVRWQASNNSDYSSPTFNQTFTIGAKDGDNYRPNTYLDLSGSPATGQYHRLNVVGTNTVNVIIGYLWVGDTVRQLTENYNWNYDRADERPGASSFNTKAGTRWTNPSIGRRRGLTGLVDAKDTGLAALATWHQACGGMDQPTIIIPDAADITDAMLVRWTVDYKFRGQFLDSSPMPVGWLELARGPAWP